jgi:NhaP-type Na+/H+ or K+/H+ antiporter
MLRSTLFVFTLLLFAFSLTVSHVEASEVLKGRFPSVDLDSEVYSFSSSLSTSSPLGGELENNYTEDENASDSHQEAGHESSTSPLFFIILAVFIGAATRHFLKAIPVPFTALLLIIGIVLGVLNRMGLLYTWGSFDVSYISESLTWAAHIDPHMLFFVFLPILIFEAAFAMDLHTFKKSAVNSVILAVPGILVALLLTGAMVYAMDILDIGLDGWANWGLAFMFGSVISATDPVAVVALLKELGASKKLGTLIEGESLLNDGTAIVLFMVFFLGISGEATDTNGFLEFLRVALGGLAVGVVIGLIVLRWIKGVFNDAMVEISVVVAAAYITFYVAEHFLHVSGVLALVALGLLIGGFGRSSISPQVEHFMHEFWELAGFIANCLIFLIVGIVIAERTEFNANDFMSLFIVYVGIHIVRAVVMLIHYPFMKNTGYGLPVKDAIVVWYGALRGAIGLALALIVAGVDPEIMSKTMEISVEQAVKIKDQFLFLIAGTVTLTLLVNATTIKALIQWLGLLDIPPAKAVMIKSSSEYMRSSAETHIQKLKSDRHLRRANWSTVAEYLPKEMAVLQDIDEKDLEIEKMAEHRMRLLEREKSSYWRQFKEGMLGAEAVRTLTETVNEILDSKGVKSLSDRDDLEDLWRPPKWLSLVQSWPIIGNITENSFFNRLAISYDCAVGFVKAQEDCLSLVESIYRAEGENEKQNLNTLEQEINENIISGQTFMRNLRNTYPEIYRAIATRQAIRSVLNYELHTVDRLKAKGRLNNSEVGRLVSDIETRMKMLMEKPPSIELPETKELVRSIPWLQELPKEGVKMLVDLFQTKIYSTGQRISKQKSASEGIYIIARGTVAVKQDKMTLALLSKGDCVGDMVYLTKVGSGHPVIAESPVTTLYLSASNMQRLISAYPVFESILWRHVQGRVAVNVLSSDVNFQSVDKKSLKSAGESGKIIMLQTGKKLELKAASAIILLQGKLKSTDNIFTGNSILKPQDRVVAEADSWLLFIDMNDENK